MNSQRQDVAEGGLGFSDVHFVLSKYPIRLLELIELIESNILVQENLLLVQENLLLVQRTNFLVQENLLLVQRTNFLVQNVSPESGMLAAIDTWRFFSNGKNRENKTIGGCKNRLGINKIGYNIVRGK